jgi:hypothetical protein
VRWAVKGPKLLGVSSEWDDFESVRRDPDPVRRGKRATKLLALYQQRATELARLRKAAIEEARDHGMTYTEVAEAFGLTKARITQIRGSAPPAERAFFGVGPVTIALPVRVGVAERVRPLIAVEDAMTVDHLEALLVRLAFTVERAQIHSDQHELPDSDAVIVCGPKSAPVARLLMDEDPHLGMVEKDGRWWIIDRRTDEQYGSPMDEPKAVDADLAYLARHVRDGRTVVHVAGLHSTGSLGAAHYLADHVGELYRTMGDESFSMVVRCDLSGQDISSTAVVVPASAW